MRDKVSREKWTQDRKEDIWEYPGVTNKCLSLTADKFYFWVIKLLVIIGNWLIPNSNSLSY